MLKKDVYRLISLGLAVLVLLSSIDYTVDMHFCQGNLKSYSLFGKAEMCYGGEQTRECSHQHHKNDRRLEKKSCCSSKVFHAKLTQNQVSASSDYVKKTTENSMVALAVSRSIICLRILNTFFKEFYDPPSVSRDFQRLLQIFRL